MSVSFTANDQRFMSRAIELAKKGRYSAKPNPCVGCVIVQNNEIIGEGWHAKAGEPHAEVHALKQAGDAAKNATAYVTLEPCSHHGKTPPCADALIKAKVSRVVVAMQDPNPLVSGKGIAKLRAANIDVSFGLLEAEALEINAAFAHKMTTGKPRIISKVAMSLDGKTAMASGESKWITGSAAREDVHRLRAQSDMVLTGIGTVLADNPALTARDGLEGAQVRQPWRVILDSQLQTPRDSLVLNSDARTTVLTCSDDQYAISAIKNKGCDVQVLAANTNGQLDLNAVSEWLNAQSVNSVMIEAGAELNGAFLQAGLVDELVIYMAPSVLGSQARGAFVMPLISKLADKIELIHKQTSTLGEDIKLMYTVKKG